MGRTLKYYPSRAFSCQRHICTTLTRKLSVAGHGAVVLYNEFREFSEFRQFSELGCIRRSHPKLSKFPIFRNQCLLSFRQFVVLSNNLYDRQLYYLYIVSPSLKKKLVRYEYRANFFYIFAPALVLLGLLPNGD